MSDALIRDVSDTAFMVAVYRALENEQPRPLFRDPLADKLAGEHGRSIVRNLPRSGPFSRLGHWLVAIRTCIIDDYIREALKDGVDAILNLGAGLDTRPYRMELPKALKWIEVDFPRIVDLKETRLEGETPRCDLRRVKLDLADREARRRLFAEIAATSKKTLVLTEGVIPYLDNDAVAALADDLRAVPVFSYWIADYLSLPARRHRARMEKRMKMQNAPFKFDPEDYFGFLKAHGWQAKEIRYIPEEAERLQRPPSLPLLFKLWVRLTEPFARGRRTGFRKAMAYVLFETAKS
ncbi:MAG TPA: SAM-dependent methyltransferase [Methylovirgula sp.]